MQEREYDELVGGWLTRLVVDNGLDSKRVLLKWLGYSSSDRNRHWMDVNILTPTWLGLAAGLGISTEELICDLSTKPYFGRFCIPSDQHPPEGDFDVPGVPLVALSRTYLRYQLQICSHCLREDCERSPYVPILRRSHQLPGTCVCHIHMVPLLDRCPTCDSVLISSLDLALSSPYCRSCGYDLRQNQAVPLSEALPICKLALFEHLCLTSRCQPKSIEQVAALIRNIGKERDLRLVDIRSMVLEQFGGFANSWVSSRFTGKAPVRIEALSMATICAHLVVLGFDFESACAAIDRIEPPKSITGHRHSRPDDVIEAQAAVLDLISTQSQVNWTFVRRRSPYAYWLLLLKDRRWLVEKLGPSRAGLHVPSIADDREQILSAQDSGQHDARIRARYRDGAWLEEALAGMLMQRASRRVRREAELADTLVSTVEEAKKRWFAKPGRPIKFTTRHAAAAASLSWGGMSQTCRRVGLPMGLLWESPAAYRLRLLRWARSTVGTQLTTPSTLLVKAGLAFTPLNKVLAASVIYLFDD